VQDPDEAVADGSEGLMVSVIGGSSVSSATAGRLRTETNHVLDGRAAHQDEPSSPAWTRDLPVMRTAMYDYIRVIYALGTIRRSSGGGRIAY
jgi:hypothetical protein